MKNKAKLNLTFAAAGRIFKIIFKHKLSIFTVFLIGAFEALICVFSPKIAGKGITALSKTNLFGGPEVNLDYIFSLLSFLLVLYSFSGLLSCLGRYIFNNICVKIVYDLRQKISRKISKVSVSYLQGKQKGDVISCIVNDAEALSSSFIESIKTLISSAIVAFGTIYMMFSISWELSLCVLLILPLMVVLGMFIASKSQKYYASFRQDFGLISGCIEESLSGYETLKSFGAEGRFTGNFDAINSRIFEASFKSELLSGLMLPTVTFLSKLIYVICCAVGGLLAVVRGLAIGDITAFIAYSDQFFRPLMDFSGVFGSFQNSFAAAERVFEFLDAPEEPQGFKNPEKSQCALEFKNVSFCYEEGKPVLKDVSFKISSGETVAIVGKTGSGKTTIAKLLLGFYRAEKGEILFGAKNVSELKLGDYRSFFGVVTQDSWVYGSDLTENIRYGNPQATDEQVLECVKSVGLVERLNVIPNSLEGGLGFSEGQKQLVCIARAVVSGREILVLDEATASVDTLTEERIQDSLSEVLSKKTAIIIAHRLSTIKNADKILVIDGGELKECGTHEQLLKKRGKYFEMYSAQ